MTTKRVPPPLVKPYDKKHLDDAKRILEGAALSEVEKRRLLKIIANKFGQWEESGWNLAMMKLRRVMEAVTFAMTPTHFEWALRRVTGEFNDKEKEAKGRKW